MQPAGRIDPPAWMTAPETRAVMAALAGEGAVARFVGGCVRDAILDRTGTVSDIDIATADPPDRVTLLLGNAGLRSIPTGIAHGTVTALSGARHYEITTLRRDVETFGRRARVAFTDDWAGDAARRDFTMNALYADADGTLYDPTGGLADLRAGRVRFVGDAALRIQEDALRLLRFFRFHAHYGRGEPDAAGLAAASAAAASLATLSGERVTGELFKLLQAATAAGALQIMARHGVLAHLLPEAPGIDRLARLVPIEATLGLSDSLRRLAALLPSDATAAVRLADRLKLSNDERERFAAIVAPALAVGADMDVAARGRALYRLGRERFVDLALLAWAAEPLPDAAAWRAHLAAAEAWVRPILPVGGTDVLALGLPPGPRVGELLAAVERWWEAGGFRAGRADALAKLREMTNT
jgi:poly(A) polymerase